jgi:hypothetical protein
VRLAVSGEHFGDFGVVAGTDIEEIAIWDG